MASKLQYRYSWSGMHTNGGVRVLQIRRNRKLVFEHRSDRPLDELFQQFNNFLNREKLDIVFVEDRVISLEEVCANLVALVKILISKLEWCQKAVDPLMKGHVDSWVTVAKKKLAEIKLEL